MQCISHAIKHLQVTHLEIIMLVYAAMNFVIYIFWWNKPLNVNQPVQAFQKCKPGEIQPHVNGPISGAQKSAMEEVGKGLEKIFHISIIGFQDGYVDLSHKERVPRFWADTTNNKHMIADAIVLGAGICFGEINCIAWHFSFPTHAELLIWQISSVSITAVLIYIPLMLYLDSWLIDMDFDNMFFILFLFQEIYCIF